MSELKDALDSQRKARLERRAANAMTPNLSSRQKILFWDVETLPMLAHIWQAKTEYVGTHMIMHDVFFATWAAKWADKKKVYSGALAPQEALDQDDSRIVNDLADMLRQADVIVAHNGDQFDEKMLNGRLLMQGLKPLGPVKSIDTLKLARKTIRVASNKLDYLATELGVGSKISTSFDLWRRCYYGDEAALKQMLRYNRQDVLILQDVYEALEPYAKGVPRLVDGDGTGGLVCPTCGAYPVTPLDVPYRTNASNFPRFECGSCGRQCRSRKADPTTKMELMPV